MRLSYDEISPITGRLSVLREFDPTTDSNFKICMESGYQSNEFWDENSDFLSKMGSTFPEYILKNKKVFDGKVWLPAMMINTHAILLPIFEGNIMFWAIKKLIDVNPDDDTSTLDIFPVVVNNEVIYKKVESVTNLFQGNEFSNALDKFFEISNI